MVIELLEMEFTMDKSRQTKPEAILLKSLQLEWVKKIFLEILFCFFFIFNYFYFLNK